MSGKFLVVRSKPRVVRSKLFALCEFGAGRSVSRRSFTLFEVLLVIVLLAALAAIVWPSLGGRGQVRLESMTSAVSSMLSFARSAAMNTGRRHRCVFSENGSRMWVEKQSDPLGSPGEFAKVKADWARLDLAGSAVRCTMVDLIGMHKLLRSREREVLEQELEEGFYEPIEFFPDGSCDSCLIVLSIASGEELGIEINGLTGQVRIVQTWQDEESTE